MEPEIYYRFIDIWSSDGRSVEVHELRIPVIRRTPQGAWIREGNWGKGRFVLDISPKFGGRRYAYADREQALRSYSIRKSRQIGHAERTLDRAKTALKLVKSPDFTLTERPFFGRVERKASALLESPVPMVDYDYG